MPRPSGATTVSRFASRAGSNRRPWSSSSHRPKRSRRWSSHGLRTQPCSLRTSARMPGGRCCCRASGPALVRRCGCSASARRTLAVASRYGSFRSSRDLPRVPSRCVRPAGPHRLMRQVQSREIPSSKPRHPRPRRSRGRCCSTTWRPICTKAMRRSPSAGPGLTLDRNLLRDLLGEAELRELLDPAALSRSNSNCSASSITARRRRSTRRMTCCGGSATWTSRRWRRGSCSPRMPRRGCSNSKQLAALAACASAGPNAGYRSKTPAASATASAFQYRSGCRKYSSGELTVRSKGCWAATRVRMGRS